MTTIGQTISRLIKDTENLKAELRAIKASIVHAPFNAGATIAATIASGIIAATRPHISLVPESGTADVLNSITNGYDGKTILLSVLDVGDTITINNYNVAAGNISLREGGTYDLSAQGDSIFLMYKSSTSRWEQIGTTLDAGTWTVTLTASTTNPTVAYTTQEAHYTRIGRAVFFSFTMVINTIAGGTGDIRIGGFPLVATSAIQPHCVVSVSGVDVPGTPISMYMQVLSSLSTAQMFAVNDDAAVSAWPIGNVANGDSISGAGFYYV